MQRYHFGGLDMQTPGAQTPGMQTTGPELTPTGDEAETQILVLAAGGRNGEALCTTLAAAGLSSYLCANMEMLVTQAKQGAGAVLLTACMLAPHALLQLQAALQQQPLWSDLPLIILVEKQEVALVANLDLRAQVTLLEQPVRGYVLVSALQAALRARVRQYELRALYHDFKEQVQMRTEQVQNLATQLNLAEQAERQRISQLLHDDLQQRLYSITFQLAIMRNALASAEIESIAQLLPEIEQTVNGAVEVTRSLSVELNPPVLHLGGFIEALHWLATQMEQQHGLIVTVQADEELPDLEGSWRELLFQAVRELLFNVVKHAGVPAAVVALSCEDGQFCIEVSDRGQGFEVNEQCAVSGQGLLRNVQRLQLMNGRIEIHSTPGMGTQIKLRVPLREQPAGLTN
jgi:signal transduction histidine kinase